MYPVVICAASVTMDGPKTVNAEWRTDNTMPYAMIGAFVGIIIILALALVLVMRRRKAPTKSNMSPASS